MALDIARKIYPPDEIAARWGFPDVPAMRTWMAAHPEFIAMVQRLRQLNEADESVLDRIQHKSAHAAEDVVEVVHSIARNPNANDKERIEAVKLLARLSGADAHAQPKGEGQGGGGGQVLNFAINFAGLPPQIISTTVVDPASIPDLSENQPDGDEPEEDA